VACRHELLWRAVSVTLEPGVESVHVRDGRSFFVADAKRCVMGCGEWLPLGPARDTAETAIEVLAAFLLNPGGFVSVAHRDYHDRDWIDEDYNYEFREDCDGCQAEHLAAAIAHHATEHGEG
jgi:hypothetical protein